MPNLVWRWAGLLAEVEGSVNHPSKTSTLHPLSILKEAVTTATHVHTSVDELGVFYTNKSGNYRHAFLQNSEEHLIAHVYHIMDPEYVELELPEWSTRSTGHLQLQVVRGDMSRESWCGSHGIALRSAGSLRQLLLILPQMLSNISPPKPKNSIDVYVGVPVVAGLPIRAFPRTGNAILDVLSVVTFALEQERPLEIVVYEQEHLVLPSYIRWPRPCDAVFASLLSASTWDDIVLSFASGNSQSGSFGSHAVALRAFSVHQSVKNVELPYESKALCSVCMQPFANDAHFVCQSCPGWRCCVPCVVGVGRQHLVHQLDYVKGEEHAVNPEETVASQPIYPDPEDVLDTARDEDFPLPEDPFTGIGPPPNIDFGFIARTATNFLSLAQSVLQNPALHRVAPTVRHVSAFTSAVRPQANGLPSLDLFRLGEAIHQLVGSVETGGFDETPTQAQHEEPFLSDFSHARDSQKRNEDLDRSSPSQDNALKHSFLYSNDPVTGETPPSNMRLKYLVRPPISEKLYGAAYCLGTKDATTLWNEVSNVKSEVCIADLHVIGGKSLRMLIIGQVSGPDVFDENIVHYLQSGRFTQNNLMALEK